jgi:hypothetical protein
MTRRTDSLIQHLSALALAAVVTLALLGSINGLASREIAADALLAQRGAAPSAQV